MCTVGTSLAYGMQLALHLIYAEDGCVLAVENCCCMVLTHMNRTMEASQHHRQPEGLQDGLNLAYHALASGFKQAYAIAFVVCPHASHHMSHSHIMQKPFEQEEDVSLSSLMRMVRSLRGAGVQPLVGACRAIALTLEGARNSLDPSKKKDLQAKYKSTSSKPE